MKINQENNIQKSFDITLKDDNLKNIAIDLGEISIDKLLEEGTLKDISIIGTIASLIKFGANIKDKLFLKKIVSFLNELKDISPKERKKIIDQIDNSKKYRIKVGEKLLYIIDNCSDYVNSELIAQLFKSFVNKKISYDDFLIGSNIIERITNYDFLWFVENKKRFMNIEDVPNSLISSGLFVLQYNPVDVNVIKKDYSDKKYTDPRSNESDYKAEIDGGDMTVSFSYIGEIIMETFNSEYKKPKSIRL